LIVRATLIGKAGALLDTCSATATSNSASADSIRPHDLDACEGRARTLDTLGRTGEAAAEFRRFVELGGANLRVRVAQSSGSTGTNPPVRGVGWLTRASLLS
jgi:hypothetical protein